MTETTITVRGTARAEHAPDRAVVGFSIGAVAAERSPALVSARETLERLADALEAHRADGRVHAWSADDLHVYADREWVGEGRPPVVRHRAAVSGSVTVVGESIGVTLPDVLDLIGGESLARVDGVDWSLSDDRYADAIAAVRHDAVSDAVEKATAYARSIGRGGLDVVALADPGMLGAGGDAPQPRMERAMALMGAAPGEGAFELRPEPVVLQATVELRAIAR